MRTRPRKVPVASKTESAAPPFDLTAVKAAVKHHTVTRYGKPVAARLLPHELDALNLLRTALPADIAPYGHRLKDGGVLKACFMYACQQLLGRDRKSAPAKKARSA